MPRNWRRMNDPERARRVSFFRNGDYFDPGLRLAIRNDRPFPTVPHLLEYLSAKTHIPAKKLFSAEDGRPVHRIDQLEDGHNYVVSSDGRFQPLPYGSVPRLQTSHVSDALPTRQEDLKLYRAAQPKAAKKRKKKKETADGMEEPLQGHREGRLLTIASKEGGSKVTLLFNDKNPPPFEDVLRDFGRAIGLTHVQHMTTPSGRPVRSISQLKNEFQDVDTFLLDEDEPFKNEIPKTAFSLVNSKNLEKRPLTVDKKKTESTKYIQQKTSIFHLDWIHGYNGGPMLSLENGELAYSVVAVVVLYKRTTDTQRYYLGHTEDVCSMCVHPSGKMLASGQLASDSQNPSVHIWMVESLQTVTVLTRLDGNPASIAFSSHDFVLMSVEVGSEEHYLTFWDWESDALLARVEMREERLIGGCFHPREPDLAVTFGEHHLAFWRRRSDGLLGRADALAPGHSGRTILSWTFVDSSTLAVGDSSGYITLWNMLPRDVFRILKEVKAHQTEVRCLLLLREGTVVSGGGNQLKAWDAEQNLLPLTISNLPEGNIHVLCSQGSADVSLYVGTSNSILEGSLQSSFKALVLGAEKECLDLAIDPQGDGFVTVDRGNNICRFTIRYLLWKVQTQMDCCCVGFHPEGQAITVGGTNGKLLVLNSEGGLTVANIAVADEALRAIAYDSGRADWNITNEKLKIEFMNGYQYFCLQKDKSLSYPTFGISQENFYGSTIAIGCDDGNIYICGSRNQGYLYKMHSILKNEWPILQIDWSEDGECLQSNYMKEGFCEAALWRVPDTRRLKSALSKNMEWPQHTCTLSHNVIGAWKRLESVFYVSCDRRGAYLATAAQDGFLRVFSFPCTDNDKNPFYVQKQSSKSLMAVRFLREKQLACASSSAIFIWNLKL